MGVEKNDKGRKGEGKEEGTNDERKWANLVNFVLNSVLSWINSTGVGWLLSRSGRSHAEKHLRLQPSPHTYNHEDDVLPTRNFGGVLGSYPRGRLYLGLSVQKEVCCSGRRVLIGNCYRQSLRPVRAITWHGNSNRRAHIGKHLLTKLCLTTTQHVLGKISIRISAGTSAVLKFFEVLFRAAGHIL
jgi:hypothetical protein